MSANYAFSVATDGMVSGKIYRMQTRSRNQIGHSSFSLISYIAFGPVPPSPGMPLRIGTTRTSISVSWSAPSLSA